MKVCQNCCWPVEQCQCTAQEKSHALWERTEVLERLIDQYEVKIRSLQDDLEIFRTFPEEKDAVIQVYEKEKTVLDYHKEHSIEIDDDFVDIIQTLWKKGYDTYFCCSGHPEKQDYGLYITFANDYDFDFTSLPLKNGWLYSRRNEYGEPSYSLYYTMPPSVKKKLGEKKKVMTAYFLEQRALLAQWIENLPPARIADYHQKLRGHGKKRPSERTGE